MKNTTQKPTRRTRPPESWKNDAELQSVIREWLADTLRYMDACANRRPRR